MNKEGKEQSFSSFEELEELELEKIRLLTPAERLKNFCLFLE